MRKFPSKPDDPAAPVPESADLAPDRLARHEPFLKEQVRRKVGRARTAGASASDLAQETWVAALEAERKGKGPEPTEKAEAAWLWKILCNKISEAFRKASAGKRGGGTAVTPIEGIEVPDPGTTPSSKVVQNSREECLGRALRSLSKKDQEVLTLTFVEGKSRREIGALLGIGERHVGNLYRDALERLRAAYVAEGGPWDFS
jgi:RNA polymerase sigma factor (sigma-70 family)